MRIIYSQVTEQKGLAGIMDMSQWLSKINAIRLIYENITSSNDDSYNRWVSLTYNTWEHLHAISKVNVINWFDSWLSCHYNMWMRVKEHYANGTGINIFSNWIELCTSVLLRKINDAEKPDQAVEEMLDWMDIQVQVQTSMVTVLDTRGMRYFGNWIKQHCRIWAFFLNNDATPSKRFMEWGNYIWKMWCETYMQNPKEAPKIIYHFLKENHIATKTMHSSEFLLWFDKKIINYI